MFDPKRTTAWYRCHARRHRGPGDQVRDGAQRGPSTPSFSARRCPRTSTDGVAGSPDVDVAVADHPGRCPRVEQPVYRAVLAMLRSYPNSISAGRPGLPSRQRCPRIGSAAPRAAPRRAAGLRVRPLGSCRPCQPTGGRLRRRSRGRRQAVICPPLGSLPHGKRNSNRGARPLARGLHITTARPNHPGLSSPRAPPAGGARRSRAPDARRARLRPGSPSRAGAGRPPRPGPAPARPAGAGRLSRAPGTAARTSWPARLSATTRLCSPAGRPAGSAGGARPPPRARSPGNHPLAGQVQDRSRARCSHGWRRRSPIRSWWRRKTGQPVGASPPAPPERPAGSRRRRRAGPP